MLKRLAVFITAAVFFIGVTPAFAKDGNVPTPNKKAYEHASDMAKFKRTGEVNKEAEKSAKRAEKEAEMAKRKADKEAEKAKKQAEKAAKRAEQEAKKKQKDMEKEARRSQKKAGK